MSVRAALRHGLCALAVAAFVALASSSALAQEDADCLKCHGDRAAKPSTEGGKAPPFVDATALKASPHAKQQCVFCHQDQDGAEFPHKTAPAKVDCATCHEEVVGQYQASIHGKLNAKGDRDAPVCVDCHGTHEMQTRKTPSSPTFPRNVPDLCARCHREGEKAAVRIKSREKDIPGAYTESIHGAALRENGLVVTATCVSCHTPHGMLPPSDPKSSVNPSNVAATCGKCHDGIEATLKTSVHWAGNTKTDKPLPTCNDCHSSHRTRRTDSADFRLHMLDQCGRCHEERAKTFFDTFHGKVSRLGNAATAKCFDCHGTHGILPPSDPASTLSSAHIVQTCGKCHPGSHAGFTTYLPHATHHDRERYPWLFWSFWGMTSLLAGTMIVALLHTAAWSWRLWCTRDEWRAHRAAVRAAEHAPGAKLYLRFDRYQRMHHLVMVVSFFTLAATGMTLKFSYAGWAGAVSTLLGGTAGMHVLHRVAALTLLTVFTVHVVSVNRRRKEAGKTWLQYILGPDSLNFNGDDLRDLKATAAWFAGRGPRPRYGRFTYWEKFDYMAVFWGVAVIGLTGLLLWFPEIGTYVLPGAAVNVATIIHSDEALLAVVFIFTIHFFNANLRPDKFPMDPAIFTGRITMEELKRDKPREYEKLLASGELEKRMVAPVSKSVERGFRVFGMIALSVGLTLVALIMYAMVFEHR